MILSSELTEHDIISLRWPRKTCTGPSILHFLLLSAGVLELLVADRVEDDFAVVMDESEELMEGEGEDLCIFQSKTVASRDPVTK